MSSVFLYVAGIKAFCSECRYGFVANKQLQRRWFNHEPLPCPTCASLQVLPQEQLATLKQDFNGVLGYMITMSIVSIANLIFLWRLLAGAYFSNTEILTMTILPPIALLVLGRAIQAKVGDLRVQLKKYDAP